MNSLAITRAIWGSNHPNSLKALKDLAYCCYNTSMLRQYGCQQYIELLARCRVSLGDNHHDTLSIMCIVADNYYCSSLNNGNQEANGSDKLKQLENGRMAKDLHHEIVQRCRDVYGNGHEYTLSVIRRFMRHVAPPSEVRILLVNSLSDATAAYGENHPVTLTCMKALGDFYSKHRSDLAIDLCITCFLKRRLVLGDDHADTNSSMWSLVNLYQQHEKYALAENLLLEWVKVSECRQHQRIFDLSMELTAIYDNQSKYSLAKQALLRCLDLLWRSEEDRPSWVIIRTLRSLTRIFTIEKQFKEAEWILMIHLFKMTFKSDWLEEHDHYTFLYTGILPILAELFVCQNKYLFIDPIFTAWWILNNTEAGNNKNYNAKDVLYVLMNVYYKSRLYEMSEHLCTEYLKTNQNLRLMQYYDDDDTHFAQWLEQLYMDGFRS